MEDEDKLVPMLTVKEVAHLLHIHANTVRRWSDEGAIKAYRITGRGDRRFKKQDVLDFLARMNGNLTSDPDEDKR